MEEEKPGTAEGAQNDNAKMSAEIGNLKQQLAEMTAERDKYKKERDEANDTLLTLKDKPKEEKSAFDKIFGGE